MLCLRVNDAAVIVIIGSKVQLFILRVQNRLEGEGERGGYHPQGADPLPPSSTCSEESKTGRNHLNEEITPLLPTAIGERLSQTK